MAKRAGATVAADPDLQVIDRLEHTIVRAHDERAAFYGVSAAEAGRQSEDAVRVARLACEQLRAEHRARIQR